MQYIQFILAGIIGLIYLISFLKDLRKSNQPKGAPVTSSPPASAASRKNLLKPAVNYINKATSSRPVTSTYSSQINKFQPKKSLLSQSNSPQIETPETKYLLAGNEQKIRDEEATANDLILSRRNLSRSITAKDFIQDQHFQSYDLKNSELNPLQTILADPSELRKAIILAEILKTKF